MHDLGFTNCTFYNNSSGNGGAFQLHSNVSMYIDHTIIWDNALPSISLDDAVELDITYSDVEGGTEDINLMKL